MYIVKTTSLFKRSFKHAQKRNMDTSLLKAIVKKLANGESLDAKHKDHALRGKYAGYRECHIQPDWLLIYLIENDILTLTLVDTGTHSDLFNK